MSNTATHKFSDNGRRIRAARHLTGLSQENFAPLIGTDRRHLIKLENGEHRPRKGMRDLIVSITGTEEQIDSSDDEEDDIVAALLDSLKRTYAKRRETGDPWAVLR